MAGRCWVMAWCPKRHSNNKYWIWNWIQTHCKIFSFLLNWFIVVVILVWSWVDKNVICFPYNNEPSLISIKSIWPVFSGWWSGAQLRSSALRKKYLYFECPPWDQEIMVLSYSPRHNTQVEYWIWASIWYRESGSDLNHIILFTL